MPHLFTGSSDHGIRTKARVDCKIPTEIGSSGGSHADVYMSHWFGPGNDDGGRYRFTGTTPPLPHVPGGVSLGREVKERMRMALLCEYLGSYSSVWS